MLLDRPVAVPTIRTFVTTPAQLLLTSFWSSPGWGRRAGRWLELVERVRHLDGALADELEDAAVEAIGEAVSFAR